MNKAKSMISKLKLKFYASFLIFFVLVPNLLFSRQRTYQHIEHTNPPYIPWFTGSLLPPSAVNAKPGHPVIASYGSIILTYGQYNDNCSLKGTSNTWAINPFIEYLFGINDYVGVEIYASFISNFKKGRSSTHFQDTIVLLGFQIANDIPDHWIPDVRFTLQETFPTGNYQKLDPDKLGIDSTGQGSFQTGFNLIAQKLFPIQNHFLVLKWSIGYLFPETVRVKGQNTYGGGPGTRGKVHPGQTLMCYFSGEYSITQRWVFAFDTFFKYQGSSTFSGNLGRKSMGATNSVGCPPIVQTTLATEIEYNFSSTSGLLFGLWFSVFGRNSPAFASGVVAYYITF